MTLLGVKTSTDFNLNSVFFLPFSNPHRKGKVVHGGNTNKYCRETALALKT